jgi:hypothetical protein
MSATTCPGVAATADDAATTTMTAQVETLEPLTPTFTAPAQGQGPGVRMPPGLDDLPIDIWEQLFRDFSLSLPDLVRLSRVCKRLHGAAHAITAMRAKASAGIDAGDLLGVLRQWGTSQWLPLLPKREGAAVAASSWPNVLFLRKVSSQLLRRDTAFGSAGPPGNVVDVVMNGVEVYGQLVAAVTAGRRTILAASLRKTPMVTVSPLLGQLHTVDLSGSRNLTAVPGLGCIHTLNLSYCSALVDVSNLGGVHTLTVDNCQALTNVAALGGVHTLYLSNCWALSDVGGLGNPGQHELHLSGCKYVVDVNHLGSVHTLRLSHCENVCDVSGLGGCHTLYLDGCSSVTDVSALKHVNFLNLSGCPKVVNVDTLECHTLLSP